MQLWKYKSDSNPNMRYTAIDKIRTKTLFIVKHSLIKI